MIGQFALLKYMYDFIMRAVQQPNYPLQRLPSHQDITYKYTHYDTVNPLKELRSLSKNKKKLRHQLFKNKNLVTQSNFYSPNKPQLTPLYSTYVPFVNPVVEQKGSKRAYPQDKKVKEQKVIVKKGEKKVEEDVKPPQNKQKEKKEFKLIHQIKREKAKKNQQKLINEQQKSDIYNQKVGHIQAMGAKEMDHFAQQLHQILHNPHPLKLQQKKTSNILNLQEKAVSSINIGYVAQETPIKQFKLKQLPSAPEEYKQPDLNRSCLKAQQILKQRKDSNSSIDVSMKLSKVREEMNISLALQSINHTKVNMSQLLKGIVQSNKECKAKTIDKLKIHIRILQTLSQFVYDSTKFDVITEEWEELNFLIYKKYYIERIKILKFINKYPMKNPFFIYNAEISSKEIIDFMKSQQGGSFKGEIIKQTSQIKQRLTSFYSHFDKGKVGQKLNLFEYDNFSHWIIEELWAYLILTQYNTEHSREVIQKRMCRTLQLIFLISELNGKYEYPFQQAELAIKNMDYQNYIKQGKQIFQKYILYKST